MSDTEAKLRTKRERLEAWRREQAVKKQAGTGTGAPAKKAKVEPEKMKLGLKGVNLVRPAPATPRVRLGLLDDDDEPQSKPKKRISLDLDTPAPKPQEPAPQEDSLDAFMSHLVDEVHQEGVSHSQASELMDPDDDTGPRYAEEEEEEDKIDSIRTEDILAMVHRKNNRKTLPTVDHASMEYEPFRKAFYHPPEELAKMTDEDAERVRMELGAISVRGKSCPIPVTKWSHCGMPVACLDVIKKLGFSAPTPIQSQALPAIMCGRDMIGVAKTGSGKTLAFLLPLFRHVRDQRPLEPGEGPIALVMTPTRELAVQIFRDAQPFLRAFGIRGVCVYGGAPIAEQIAELKRTAELVVATPGRMIDLLAANSGRVTNLQRTTYLVLDEADRMFDLGFEPQVMKILALVRPDRQTVLFSATFPRAMEGLARKMLRHEPLEVTVGGRSVVPPEITQQVEVRAESTKFHRLLEVLGHLYHTDEDARALVFVERQDSADELMHELMKRGYPAMSLHGGKDQADRDTTISDFKSGIVPILTATSVAARGLDVKQLKLVVNYDVPSHLEDYVHRAGRTGRAGNRGTCVTFITPEQERYAKDLVAALRASKADVPPELEKMVSQFKNKIAKGTEKATHSGFGGRGLERLELGRQKLLQAEASIYIEDEEADPEAVAARAANETQRLSDADIPICTGPVPEAVRENKQPVYTDADQLANQARLDAARAAGADTTKLQEVIARINAVANQRREEWEKSRRARDPDATKFHAIFPINDFPQKARWNVTNKETMAMLIESTGASSTLPLLTQSPTRVPFTSGAASRILVSRPSCRCSSRATIATVSKTPFARSNASYWRAHRPTSIPRHGPRPQAADTLSCRILRVCGTRPHACAQQRVRVLWINEQVLLGSCLFGVALDASLPRRAIARVAVVLGCASSHDAELARHREEILLVGRQWKLVPEVPGSSSPLLRRMHYLAAYLGTNTLHLLAQRRILVLCRRVGD